MLTETSRTNERFENTADPASAEFMTEGLLVTTRRAALRDGNLGLVDCPCNFSVMTSTGTGPVVNAFFDAN